MRQPFRRHFHAHVVAISCELHNRWFHYMINSEHARCSEARNMMYLPRGVVKPIPLYIS